MRSSPRTSPASTGALSPKNGFGGAITDSRQSLGNDDYVWPKDLAVHRELHQGRQREVSAPGTLRDPRAEHKRTDFEVLRDVAVERAETLGRDDLHLSVPDRPDRLRRAADRYAKKHSMWAARKGATSAAP